jgi:hypothetical protein
MKNKKENNSGNFKINGIKLLHLKIAALFILSNFVFLLLSNDEEIKEIPEVIRDGHVKLSINAKLHTPFDYDKKVMLISKNNTYRMIYLKKYKELDESIFNNHKNKRPNLVVEVPKHLMRQIINEQELHIYPDLEKFNLSHKEEVSDVSF